MTVRKVIAGDELKHLTQLIGKKYSFLAGASIIPALNSDAFVLGAEDNNISIWGDYLDATFGEESDEFSFFRIGPAEESEWKSLLQQGLVTFRHKGETITDIHLVRLALFMGRGANRKLVFETDRGIIFHFSRSSLALARRSLHLEMIEAVFAEESQSVSISEISTHYSPYDSEYFEWTETVIPLSEAEKQE
jgi:hypothetical protein